MSVYANIDSLMYNQKIYKKMINLSYTEVDYITSCLMYQMKILDLKDITFSTYKINCNNFNTELIIKNFTKDTNEWYCLLQNQDEYIYMDMLSHESFLDYIKLNKKLRYISIPVLLSPEYNNFKMGGHIVSLIIDNVLEEIYLFDPNGKSNYFNFSKNKIVKSNNLVNKLFTTYFNDMYNLYNFNYTFVSNIKSGASSYIINRQLDYKYKKGYCMIIAILLPYYLSITQLYAIDGIKLISKLNNKKLLKLIKLYSVKCYNILLKN